MGGNYRDITGAFVGTLTFKSSNLQFSKAYVSSNACLKRTLATFSEEEGGSAIALNSIKMLSADHSKFWMIFFIML